MNKIKWVFSHHFQAWWQESRDDLELGTAAGSAKGWEVWLEMAKTVAVVALAAAQIEQNRVAQQEGKSSGGLCL